MKTALVLGAGGFIGSHLVTRLKEEGFWVRVVDIKMHEYFNPLNICDDFVIGDLRDPLLVNRVMFAPNQSGEKDFLEAFDEVY